MTVLLVLTALLPFVFDSAPEIHRALCPADSIYIVIYRHVDLEQANPIVVDDSIRIYEPGVTP